MLYTFSVEILSDKILECLGLELSFEEWVKWVSGNEQVGHLTKMYSG